MRKTAEQLEAALATLLPDQPISGVRPLMTGFSNETYALEGTSLILRLPPAAGAMLEGHGVVDQARIYAALSATAGAPPVPAITFIGEDPTVLGEQFFVMERVGGEAIHDIHMQPWFVEADVTERNRVCRDWISAFAVIGRLAPLDALGAPLTPEEDLGRWRSFAARANSDATVDAIDRLLKRPAPRSGPPSVVHGDPKLSNLMWHDKQISAVLDWEMALNGEPLGDLAYMLYGFESAFHPALRAQKLPGMLDREGVIALWSEVSGRSSEGVEWHEIAQFAKLCAILAEGVDMFVSGRSDDPKLAYFQDNLDGWIALTNAMLAAQGL